MTTVIGIDAATAAKKLGLARGRVVGDTVTVEEVVRGSEVPSPAQTIAAWIRGPTLLAIDAPLGWPLPVAQALGQHRAGRGIHVPANELFRRLTDRHVRATLGKTPLDVGADRIARTAHFALRLLDEIRRELGEEIPLAWTPELTAASAV